MYHLWLDGCLEPPYTQPSSMGEICGDPTNFHLDDAAPLHFCCSQESMINHVYMCNHVYIYYV